MLETLDAIENLLMKADVEGKTHLGVSPDEKTIAFVTELSPIPSDWTIIDLTDGATVIAILKCLSFVSE